MISRFYGCQSLASLQGARSCSRAGNVWALEMNSAVRPCCRPWWIIRPQPCQHSSGDFLSHGVPLVIIQFNGLFHCKPSFGGTSIYGTPHVGPTITIACCSWIPQVTVESKHLSMAHRIFSGHNAPTPHKLPTRISQSDTNKCDIHLSSVNQTGGFCSLNSDRVK